MHWDPSAHVYMYLRFGAMWGLLMVSLELLTIKNDEYKDILF